MAFTFDTKSHFYLCRNHRRHFFILLLFNSFLASTYYLHSQSLVSRSSKWNSYAKKIETKPDQRQNTAVNSIRNILENEYNHEDLVAFYHLVKKEFALGLRCTRNAKQPPPAISNQSRNQQITNNNNAIMTGSSLPVRSSFYSFIINNSDICSNETIDLVIVIISKSENYKTRDAIRRTWGSGKNLGKYSSLIIKFFFLIDFDEKLSNSIGLENDLFHDIIQVKLPQQYTLVTHRVLSLFEWSFRFCRSAKFVFKTDDDIFINLFLLLEFTLPLIGVSSNNSFRISDMSIYGWKHYNSPVWRAANDPVIARYVVTEDEFPCRQYPDFLSGFGYLIPRKARDALVYAAYQDPNVAFRLSDVYLTGILPDYLSLRRHPMTGYTLRDVGDCENFFVQPNAFACAAGAHHGNQSDVFQKFNNLWQHLRKSI